MIPRDRPEECRAHPMNDLIQVRKMPEEQIQGEPDFGGGMSKWHGSDDHWRGVVTDRSGPVARSPHRAKNPVLSQWLSSLQYAAGLCSRYSIIPCLGRRERELKVVDGKE